MQYTTPVPERLAEDLQKSRLTVRYMDDHGHEHTVEFEGGHLEFVPRIVVHGDVWQRIPLHAVRSIEVDDEFTSPCDTDYRGVEVPQRLVVARWHLTEYGLLRFVPQGNV